MSDSFSMRRGIRTLAVASLSTLPLLVPGSPGPMPAAAQVVVGGQVRPRGEVRDPVDGGTEAFTSMRTRAWVGASLGGDAAVFVQLQDVRLWGEESSTLGDFQADALDLHQAWVEFGHEDVSTLWVRAGRQETSLGGERLVGAVNWTQQGRAFDGVRGAALLGELRLDLFGYQLAEETSGTFAGDASLLGAYGVLDVGHGGSLDLYVLHDRRETAADLRRSTLGLRLHGATGPWSYRAEGSYQTGTSLERDIGAWMIGARVGHTFMDGRSGVTLWYDLLSGDPDPADDEVEAFNTLYATNHKFYGYADLFLDIPASTAQRGLADAAVKTFLDVGRDLRFSADLHYFRVAEDRGLTTARLGEELDLTGQWRYADGLSFTGGMSYVLQGDGFEEIGRLDQNLVWAYLMLNAEF